MIKTYIVVLLLFTLAACTHSQTDEYRGILGEDGGEYSIGQTTWRYPSGKFIVYGGEYRELYYMLFSDAPWGSFDAFDYPLESPQHPEGGFGFTDLSDRLFLPFKNDHLLLIFVTENLSIEHRYIQMNHDEWLEIMEPYANRIEDEDYDVILEDFMSRLGDS